MRWTRPAAAGLLLLCLAATGYTEEQAGKLCIYSPRCLTNSPRLIKVQHSPESESYSYFYQVPRRIRKVVRRKIIEPETTELPTTEAPTTAEPAADAAEDDHRALFDHIQLTPVFGRRISSNRTAGDDDTERPAETETPAEFETPAPERDAVKVAEATAETETEFEIEAETEVPVNEVPARRRRPASRGRRRFRLPRPAAPSAAPDADLSEVANRLEAASSHGSPSDARAFRAERLKRRRKIMAKKLVRKQFFDPPPTKKIIKVVAVRKPPRVIPGLSEVYHDSLINSLISEEYPALKPSPGIKGFPGVDYPIYTRIPETSFSCGQQRYWGMYADTETQCQVWHYCDQDGNKHSFLCPNGTVFSQVTFICDWWFNVDCNNAVQLYVTNEALSLLPAPPEKTFPEDFKGPIVDWYIYQRHQERAYRKEKFLRQLEEGKQQKAIKFLETHDFPPWFTARDQKLYLKLKQLERKSKHNVQPAHRPVKKELTQYAPRW